MLYQLWGPQRLHGNLAGHNDAPKLGTKKKKKTRHFDVLVNKDGVVWHFFLVFWASRDFEVKFRFSYNSLDFEEFFCFVLFLFSFFSLRCNRATLRC